MLDVPLANSSDKSCDVASKIFKQFSIDWYIPGRGLVSDVSLVNRFDQCKEQVNGISTLRRVPYILFKWGLTSSR